MKPRLLRLFVIVLVLTAAFVWLGNWQWQTAHNKANQKVLEQSNARAPEPLDEVLKPQTMFDNSRSLQPVRATGHYDAAKTELVAERMLDGKRGYWLMTPLVVDTTGARIPIVRGFVTQTTNLSAATSGTVTVEGALAPGESVSTLGTLPSGQIGTIDMGLLLNEWGGDVYNGFVFETKQTPAAATPSGAARVQLVPPPVPKATKIDLRNAAYAWQWWIFAVFAVFMYLRVLREEHTSDAGATHAGEHADADPDGGVDASTTPESSIPSDHAVDAVPTASATRKETT